EFNPADAINARINLALGCLDQPDCPTAKEDIDNAIAHDGNDYLPYSVLAYYYQQTGDLANSQKAYQKALKLSQNRPDVLNNYGTFLCKQGQFQQAYLQFEQALQSKHAYYHQADTLENIILCAKSEPNSQKFNEAFAQLGKLDKIRADKLR
ncbi:MAG: tetratricopeptide repeat protein, partial [Haemophilus parahaemolyticus]|nr:tetratricopeptide repeat protein [Haemophilus parahaemolyticus]